MPVDCRYPEFANIGKQCFAFSWLYLCIKTTCTSSTYITLLIGNSLCNTCCNCIHYNRCARHCVMMEEERRAINYFSLIRNTHVRPLSNYCDITSSLFYLVSPRGHKCKNMWQFPEQDHWTKSRGVLYFSFSRQWTRCSSHWRPAAVNFAITKPVCTPYHSRWWGHITRRWDGKIDLRVSG